jgi:hypothetical protein
LILLILLFLVFIFPIAVYLLILGLMNRRDRPMVLSGVWDFVGVLWAASGLLLFVCPGALAALHERWQLHFLVGGSRAVEALGEEGQLLWTFISALYFTVVVSGAAWLLFRRRQMTSIYNIEPPVFDTLLAGVLDRLGCSWARAGNQLFIKPGTALLNNQPAQAEMPRVHTEIIGSELAHAAMRARTLTEALAGSPLAVAGLAVLEVEPFWMMYHVTMRWRSADPAVRQEIERELVKDLGTVQTRETSLGGWFLTLAALMFFAICLALGLLILANTRAFR